MSAFGSLRFTDREEWKSLMFSLSKQSAVHHGEQCAVHHQSNANLSQENFFSLDSHFDIYRQFRGIFKPNYNKTSVQLKCCLKQRYKDNGAEIWAARYEVYNYYCKLLLMLLSLLLSLIGL